MCFYQGFEMSELQCNLRSRFYLQKCFLIQDITAFGRVVGIILNYKFQNVRNYRSCIDRDILRNVLKARWQKRFIAARFKDKRLHQLSCIFLLFENKNKFMFWFERKRFAQHDFEHIYVRFVQCHCSQNKYLSIVLIAHT